MTATNGASPKIDEADLETDVEDAEAEAETVGTEVDAELEDTADDEADADETEDPPEDTAGDTEDAIGVDEDPDAEEDTEVGIEASGPPQPPLTPAAPAPAPSDEWTSRQLGSVLFRALAVGLALAIIGFGIGIGRGGTNIARAEFVYTLDQSVPDSFLREDRRLLTQVATFTSDAVLIPVARQFDLDVDDLRASIDIETVALSEVLRLEVTNSDAGLALALNRAVLDQYLQIITAAAPAGDSLELSRQRDEVLAQLAEGDQERQALATSAERDAVLDVRQDSIQRQIDLTRDRTAAIQGLVDDALFTSLGQSRLALLTEELEASQARLAALEGELIVVVGDRAELATATTAEPALLRDIERLESQLSTIDEELSQRELGPLVASPIRELSEPTVIERSAVWAGIQGAAIGALIALPLAAWVAYRTRRRQLWFG